MPFAIPSLQELCERSYNAFTTNLKGSDARLWPNNVNVSAKVMGGMTHAAFGFVDYVRKQMFVHSAEGIWLDAHGREYGIARHAPAFASGKVNFTGTPGALVPGGAELSRADGQRYLLDAAVNLTDNGTGTGAVSAVQSGRLANSAAGVALNLTAPIANIDTQAHAHVDTIAGGTDTEGDESYRARLLHRKRFVPMGGAIHDWVTWVSEVPGVTRVFVDPVTSLGGRRDVGIWFMMDDLYGDGIPQPADVERVKAYLEMVRPAGAIYDVRAPVPVGTIVRLRDLAPDTVEVRDRIRNELADFFRRGSVLYGDTSLGIRVSTTAKPFTLYRSRVSEAVSIAAGEHHHVVEAPAEKTTFTVGQVPVFAGVEFAS